MKRLVVTIDGPAGAGKTTVSKRLAARLDYRYIVTGALYRGVAFEAKASGISGDDDKGLSELCRTLTLSFERTDSGLRLISNGVDITDHIRTAEVTMLASAVSARRVVREYLFNVQRNFGVEKNIVIEGRDMGTVVFPDADIKFFLDADAGARAQRRYTEIRDTSGETLESIENDMRVRDRNDSSRQLAPLKPAGNAIIIDSTHLTVEAVVEEMLSHVDAARQN